MLPFNNRKVTAPKIGTVRLSRPFGESPSKVVTIATVIAIKILSKNEKRKKGRESQADCKAEKADKKHSQKLLQ